MQEADTAGVPVQTSKRQKLNIVGIGKVKELEYQTILLSKFFLQAKPPNESICRVCCISYYGYSRQAQRLLL